MVATPSSLSGNESIEVRLGLEELTLGYQFHASEIYTDAVLDSFETLSGDHSPLHTDSGAAVALGFPDRLVYGFQMAALLSRIVGTHLRSAVCASVSLDFVKPVFVGEEVRLTAEVAQIQPTLRSVVLRAQFTRNDEVVARGKLTTQFL
jgi:3-hydroxybutyryl-CoA dehydratase